MRTVIVDPSQQVFVCSSVEGSCACQQQSIEALLFVRRICVRLIDCSLGQRRVLPELPQLLQSVSPPNVVVFADDFNTQFSYLAQKDFLPQSVALTKQIASLKLVLITDYF